MTEKRYYTHKHSLKENEVHDKICHRFMSIDETVEHLNNEYWKYKQLKKEKCTTLLFYFCFNLNYKPKRSFLIALNSSSDKIPLSFNSAYFLIVSILSIAVKDFACC